MPPRPAKGEAPLKRGRGQAQKDWSRRRRVFAPREKKIRPLEADYSVSEE